ncbi:hypothetical protein GLE_1037 [Lysobacter enzymogenes]|uniref:Uncharacterized protein n=1 Tax=Lysobacter enzymogenes TaxID=69 RepID=A0A0S2DCY6_LYSEN|nr:hypothetical protein GLE_1037 [Lysobacter enzymogenes]
MWGRALVAGPSGPMPFDPARRSGRKASGLKALPQEPG